MQAKFAEVYLCFKRILEIFEEMHEKTDEQFQSGYTEAVCLTKNLETEERRTVFLYKQHFYKQRIAEIGQKLSKCYATPWG